MGEIYSEVQLREQGLIYFNGDILATNVWINKYALKTKKGDYLEFTPDDTIKRIVKEIERAESKHPNPLSRTKIYNALKGFQQFIFGGSILFGLGNNEQVSSLGNCFFIDNGADSYGGIFMTEQGMVQLMKRRGGVGITLEHLRPETSLVNNAAQTSTGAVSFMDRFSHGTREVAQDGRRGALMITMHVNHPDILEFIMKKDDLTKVTGANVSVKVTDEFMEAVEHDRDYYLAWPIQAKQPDIRESLPYNSLHILEDGTHVRRVKAKEVWNTIVHQAHKNAEPGVLFWDNVVKESPADSYAEFGFKTLGTNPCGAWTMPSPQIVMRNISGWSKTVSLSFRAGRKLTPQKGLWGTMPSPMPPSEPGLPMMRICPRQRLNKVQSSTNRSRKPHYWATNRLLQHSTRLPKGRRSRPRTRKSKPSSSRPGHKATPARIHLPLSMS